MESTTALMTDIDGLVMAEDPFGAKSALVADLFSINDTQIDIPVNVDFDLVSPFCVAESSVLEFGLAVTVSDSRLFNLLGTRGAGLALLINESLVAEGAVDDRDTPSSLSLRYRGRVEVDSEVRVAVFLAEDDLNVFIPAKGLQWGYKLYGPQYNLLEDLSMDCLS